MRDKILKFMTNMPSWYLILPVFLIIIAVRFSDVTTVSPVSEESQKVFKTLESIKPGSKVMILVNYGPEGRAELEEALSTLITFLAKRESGIIFVSMIPAGIESVSTAVEKSLSTLKGSEIRYLYGRDYINLGYIAGGSIAAGMLAGHLTEMRVHDIYSNELKNMPVMNGINSFNDLSGFFEFSSMKIDDIPGAVMISMFSRESSVPVTVFCTADTVLEYAPFVKSGTVGSIAGGFRNIVAVTKMLDPDSNDDKRYLICSAVLLYMLAVIAAGVFLKLFRGPE